MALLDPNRLLPQDPANQNVAREIFDGISDLPIFSPHGHTDPNWFSQNEPFTDATSLFLTPDHYVLRLMRSQGINFDNLGIPRRDNSAVANGRTAWRSFAQNYHILAGTPSRLWIDHAMEWGFGVDERLCAENADLLYDQITTRLSDDDMLPLAILDRANVEVIATTEFALDPLDSHKSLAGQGMIGRIRTTYRPDDVTDPDDPDFKENLRKLGDLTGCDVYQWNGMIEAHRRRRELFRKYGATATDHGVPDFSTVDLTGNEKQNLLNRIVSCEPNQDDARLFRAQMLTEMAALSVEDGMVMQVHAGIVRNTDTDLLKKRGKNLGADIPHAVSPVSGLAALLNKFGNIRGFRLVVFCLDESTYSRELAPMAGYWPALVIGPPWWFHDSPRGIARYLDSIIETAGFYNVAGFNDDTRALFSIPARHDVWRRSVSTFLSGLITAGLLGKGEAQTIAAWLAGDAAKQVYNLA